MTARSIRLRPWQKRALDALQATPGPDFLAVATPGAGKTTFALTAALTHLGQHPRARVVVVAPTQHLKLQWARAASALGLHLDPEWTSRDGALPPDMHGVVVTYQQVAGTAGTLARLSAGAVVVLDELHHAGDDRAWGEAVLRAFEPAARRLALSGTPFRSDDAAIPFVRYVDDEAQPDFTYGYGDALADGGVVRPVWFPRLGGHMEWQAPDGSLHAHTFDDELDRARSGQRLRTALSLEGEWLPTVLTRAHRQLQEVRGEHPAAAGLVIAIDHDHARGIADLMAGRIGVRPVVVLSDDPRASERIAAFGASTQPWIVAVRMVSEGVDLPRIRVGVFATTTTTELFFRQAVGRLVRWTPGAGPDDRAWMHIPDDPRLRTWAARIADERRHQLRQRSPSSREPEAGELDAGPGARLAGDDEQLSLFAAISAVATDEADPLTVAGPPAPPPQEHEGVELVLTAPPRPGAESGAGPGAVGVLTRREEKRRLRDHNAEAARELVRRTGRSHAEVNRELNWLSGVRSVSEATVEQLRRRLSAAERWLSSAP